MLLDPAKVRKKKLDAYQVGKTKSGLIASMKMTESEEIAETLEIRLAAKGTKGKLVIAFGPYRVKAGMKMYVDA